MNHTASRSQYSLMMLNVKYIYRSDTQPSRSRLRAQLARAPGEKQHLESAAQVHSAAAPLTAHSLLLSQVGGPTLTQLRACFLLVKLDDPICNSLSFSAYVCVRCAYVYTYICVMWRAVCSLADDLLIYTFKCVCGPSTNH